jgi:hypothetical protein
MVRALVWIPHSYLHVCVDFLCAYRYCCPRNPDTIDVVAEAKSLSGKLGGKGMKLVPIMKNLVDQVWGSSRPPRPASKIYPLDIKYTGGFA